MAGSFDKSEIVEFFLVEANDHLQNLNAGLLALEKEPGNRATIDELFRAAHTLKGSAAMMGFQGISDVSHKAEDMLGQFRSGGVPICKETLNFLFDTVDAVKLMVEGVAAHQPEDPLLIESIAQHYKDTLAGLRGAPPLSPAAAPASAAPAATKPAAAAPPSLKPETPAPKPAVAASPVSMTEAPAAPSSKDDIDLAWEKTFDMIEEEAIEVEPIGHEEAPEETIEVEPLAEEESVELAAPAPEPLRASAQPAEAAPKVAGPAAGPAPAPDSPVIVPDAALKQEIEEGKQAGLVEKRGLGRRASDAPDIEKQFIRVNIERLDNLMNLVGELVVNRNRLVQQVDFIKSVREELAFSQKRLLHEVKKFEEKYEYTLTVGVPVQQAAAERSHDFQELEFDRYDDFNLLSRKLAEISNDTNEIMMELGGFFDTFELDTSKISTITTMLQGEITQARMVEMDRLFQLFQRPVRDLAQQESKQVNMVVLGGETKIDKTIFEIISDPMMHMVRNAVSHGIESADRRKTLGKDPVGTLLLNARHEGNNIVIEIEDDGAGMTPAVLRKAAVDKGFLSAPEAEALTDLDAINLIFRPGFSTAQAVGKVSGRGVGMDVVSNQLAKINGRIEIKTSPGVGTKFTVRLPLTLVISQSLIVKLRDQEVAVPMSLVEETTRFANKEVQRVAGEEMVNLRGELLRLLRLNELLGVGKMPKKDEGFRVPALVLGMAEKRLALMVEDIMGREEIVVKSLGDYLKSLRMFSGATISGDGNVRLILNVNALFGEEQVAAKAGTLSAREVVAATAAAAAGTAAPGATVAPAGPRRKPRVLVVDDSISIRKFVQRFLDRTGYEVEVAADGMAALETMGKAKFDVVITDLEMPVMHGYDLMAEMKRNAALANVPVIVLTSRAGDKHRQKAIEMGAQDYLVKPFEEQEMLATLKKVLSGRALASPA